MAKVVSVSLRTPMWGPDEVLAIDMGGCVGTIECGECAGTGVFSFYPEDYPSRPEDLVCRACKGKGRLYSMIMTRPEA